VFRAPSTLAVLEAYFDPKHQSEQDRALDIARRDILELDQRGDELRRVCRVVPERQLPAIVRPLLAGELCYVETALWRRSENEIAIDIRMGKRVHITATYALELVGANAIRRTYRGAVSVDIALVAARIERGIVTEFADSMPLAAGCTQAWLDRHEISSVAVRA
jgi:hypothetical protein